MSIGCAPENLVQTPVPAENLIPTPLAGGFLSSWQGLSGPKLRSSGQRRRKRQPPFPDRSHGDRRGQLRRPSDVSMVQTTDLRRRDDRSDFLCRDAT